MNEILPGILVTIRDADPEYLRRFQNWMLEWSIFPLATQGGPDWFQGFFNEVDAQGIKQWIREHGNEATP